MDNNRKSFAVLWNMRGKSPKHKKIFNFTSGLYQLNTTKPALAKSVLQKPVPMVKLINKKYIYEVACIYE